MTRLGRLRRRPEFLRVAGANRKWVAPGVIVQAAPRLSLPPAPSQSSASPSSPPALRFGLTASRKVGNAVARNRARRRLRAAAQAILSTRGRADCDYVLIARAGTLTRAWNDLIGDLETALERLERRGGRPA